MSLMDRLRGDDRRRRPFVNEFRRPHWVVRVSAAGEEGVPLVDVPGDTAAEVEDNFRKMMANNSWITVDYVDHGQPKRLVFRSEFVTGFVIEQVWI